MAAPPDGIAFLGLGAMGAPMAARVATLRAPLAVYDVVEQRAQAAVALGARAARSPAEAARDARVVLVMVVDESQARDALLGEDGAATTLHDNAVIVVLSTVGPAAVRRLAADLRPRGIEVIDAPVSGGVARAGRGELLIMAAGPRPTFERVHPVLAVMGSHVVHCGERVGDGQSVKLVNQLLCGVHIAVAGEALTYAKALGLDPGAVHETIRHGAAGSFMLDDRGARMIGREFEPARSALDIFVKDLGLVVDAANERRFPTLLSSVARQLFLMGSAQGLGRDDDSGIVRVFEQWHQPPSRDDEPAATHDPAVSRDGRHEASAKELS